MTTKFDTSHQVTADPTLLVDEIAQVDTPVVGTCASDLLYNSGGIEFRGVASAGKTTAECACLQRWSARPRLA